MIMTISFTTLRARLHDWYDSIKDKFTPTPDYALHHRPPKWHEALQCSIFGHNFTEWQPRPAWMFWRICRTCRKDEHELGENILRTLMEG